MNDRKKLTPVSRHTKRRTSASKVRTSRAPESGHRPAEGKPAHGIARGALSASTPVHEVQAAHFAKCATNLDRAYDDLNLNPEMPPEQEELERFLCMEEYRFFCDAAYACGFVCDDLEPADVLEAVHRDPRRMLNAMDFSELRRYVHTLLRAEKWSAPLDSPVLKACASGAVALLAQRLSEESLIIDRW